MTVQQIIDTLNNLFDLSLHMLPEAEQSAEEVVNYLLDMLFAMGVEPEQTGDGHFCIL